MQGKMGVFCASATKNRLPKKAVIYNASKLLVEISGIEPLTS